MIRVDDEHDERLQSALTTLRDRLAQATEAPRYDDGSHPAIAFSLPTLQYLQQSDALVERLTADDAGAGTQRPLHDLLVGTALDGLQATSGELPGPQRQVAEFLVGAFLALCTWWLREAQELPAEAVDDLYRVLAMGGLHG